MKIINNQNYFTDKQLTKIINHLDTYYYPEMIILYETRLDLLRYIFKINIIESLSILFDIFVWAGKREGFYIPSSDTVMVFIFSENDDGYNRHSKQLYSLHALLHELRHRQQFMTDYKGNEEDDADLFATEFINDNSKILSKIMNWKDEWEVEEE